MRPAPVGGAVAQDQFVFFVAGVIGFGPSIGVLYHGLRTYDYPYTEKSYFETRRVFLALAVGMVIGTVTGAMSVGFRLGITSLLSLVVLLLLLALFEEGFKLVYLNRKGYRGRFDTTFVGLSAGVGIAAIVAAGSAYSNGPGLFAASSVTTLLAFSASLAFVHGATGAILGYGCSRGEIVVALAQAYVARVLHAAMLVPFFVWSGLPDPEANLAVPLLSLVGAVVFTMLLYLHVYRSVLPETLPPELRRERRRRVRTTRTAKE